MFKIKTPISTSELCRMPLSPMFLVSRSGILPSYTLLKEIRFIKARFFLLVFLLLAYEFLRPAVAENLEYSYAATASYGIGFRTQKMDPDLVSTGNSNFDKWDPVNSPARLNFEVGLKKDWIRAFFRGNYFYDWVLQNENLPEKAKRAQDYATLLDAYVELAPRSFGIGRLTFRAGNQVVSWGESTFIGNSINSINAFDVGKLRMPNATLKEAQTPTNMVYAQYGLTQDLTFEALYLLEWEKTRLDPMGTFWSSLDAISDGGNILPLTSTVSLSRAESNKPDRSGQFGISSRYYFSPWGMEFGAYYENLHSNVPNISGISGANPEHSYYFLDYAKNVRIFGLSFNSRIGPYAVYGEMSYRPNAPIQRSNFANVAFTPYPPQKVERGFGRISLAQAQLTVQRLFGPVYFAKADAASVIGEIGVTHTRDKNKYRDLLAPIDSTSWGYTISADVTYNRVIANAINLVPNITITQNVEGTLGPFFEDQKTITIGVRWDARQRWSGLVAYTNYFDGGDANVMHDRDYLSLEVSRQF